MAKLRMPDFKTEAEEATWWYENQDQIAREALEQMGLELLSVSAEDAALGKQRASACGMPYEEYMRQLVHRALREQRAA